MIFELMKKRRILMIGKLRFVLMMTFGMIGKRMTVMKRRMIFELMKKRRILMIGKLRFVLMMTFGMIGMRMIELLETLTFGMIGMRMIALLRTPGPEQCLSFHWPLTLNWILY